MAGPTRRKMTVGRRVAPPRSPKMKTSHTTHSGAKGPRRAPRYAYGATKPATTTRRRTSGGGSPLKFPGNPGSLVISSAERIKSVTSKKR